MLSIPFDTESDIYLGNPNGKAKLVWYFDYADSHSREIREIMLRTAQRVGRSYAAIAFRFLPSSKESSQLAARAALAANIQGQFEQMHHRLFESSPDYDKDIIIDIARDIGLDIEQFKRDFLGNHVAEQIGVHEECYASSGPYSGTVLFIDNEPYLGAWDETTLLETLERPLGVRLRLASDEFIRWAASAGFVLVLATIVALLFVNFGYVEQYEHLRETRLGIQFGEHTFALPLEQWVNDGLMAIFFLLVGIEIKREMVSGELSTVASAALPIIGAIGGMVAPALIYVLFNYDNPETAHGWGIPMATDIAFTLGILALLGSRVPIQLKVFVSALAIADDLGAIIVIALFYGHGFDLHAFIIAMMIYALMWVLNIGRVYQRIPYLMLGAALWYFVFQSGLHATLAGVLTAMAIPSRKAGNMRGVASQTALLFDSVLGYQKEEEAEISGAGWRILENAMDRLREPSHHLQESIENFSNYFILPLFAFFNTGILVIGMHFDIFAPEIIGVILGLCIGKPLGICLSCYLAIKFGMARLSSEISIRQFIAASFLAGVGFTMSIFIASAAFHGEHLEGIKLAILIGSVISACIGVQLFLTQKPNKTTL